MASPNPAGFLSSSAAVRTTAVEQARAVTSGVAALASPAAGVGAPLMQGGVLAGLVVAVAVLVYWYRRIL